MNVVLILIKMTLDLKVVFCNMKTVFSVQRNRNLKEIGIWNLQGTVTASYNGSREDQNISPDTPRSVNDQVSLANISILIWVRMSKSTLPGTTHVFGIKSKNDTHNF